MPYDAEADAILLQALPEAIASLVTLSRSPNRCTARQALKMLRRYLYERSIAVTATLGTDAARVHLAAIALVEECPAELTGSKRIPH